MTRPLFMRVKRPRDPFQDEIDKNMKARLTRHFLSAISARAASINEERNRSRHGQTSGFLTPMLSGYLG